MRQSMIRVVYFGLIRTRAAERLARWLVKVVGDSEVTVVDRTLSVPGLPAAADGLRILHLSDLHLGSQGPDIKAVAAAASRLGSVDLVVHTGDFIDDDSGIAQVAELLRLLPGGVQSIAVLGNHDYYSLSFNTERNDTGRLVDVLLEAGVDVLINRAIALPEWGLNAVGVDDPVTGRCDLSKAWSTLTTRDPTILLSHSPDVVFSLQGRRPLALLAGHTHGGQVCLPGLGAVVRVSQLPRRRQAGVQTIAGVRMHVSAGVGDSGPQLRIGCPAEIVRLTLVTEDRPVT